MSAEGNIIMLDFLSWMINILSMAGWFINIKYRRWAMWIFTVSTVLSIGYFWATWQVPFLARSVVYLFIDIATLWNIYRERPA
jgi:hypothetical protein